MNRKKEERNALGYLLAVDTSSALLGVGLMPHYQGDRAGHIDTESEQIRSLEIDAGLGHVERLAPAVEELLELTGVSPGELLALVAPRGPGSFTGLRIAVSLIKGMAAATGAPIILVPTLEAYAEPLRGEQALVLSLLDARQARFYVQFFRNGDYLTPALDLSPAAIAGRAATLRAPGERILLAGPDAGRLEGIEGASPAPLRRRSAVRGLLVRGEAALLRGQTVAEDVGPLYLRGSEAVFPRRKGPSSPRQD
ncbi:MAG: tRNA (adenosine(37)-N6)-threonylcarbamoyltransferase complex dimerization subunit type 1 TsaB [Alkalispirochaetaceae bacterium]